MNFTEIRPRCGWIAYRRRQAILASVREAVCICLGLSLLTLGLLC